MAVYFIRETQMDECIGCGACADICPVDAVAMVDDCPVVEANWCIGCGVCAVSCAANVISLHRRMESRAPESFAELHNRIKQEKETPETVTNQQQSK